MFCGRTPTDTARLPRLALESIDGGGGVQRVMTDGFPWNQAVGVDLEVPFPKIDKLLYQEWEQC